MVELKMYEAEEWAQEDGMTVEELAETYGADAKRFFVAEKDGEFGAMLGIGHDNGSYDVVGCGRDVMGVSYEAMLAAVADEFMN